MALRWIGAVSAVIGTASSSEARIRIGRLRRRTIKNSPSTDVLADPLIEDRLPRHPLEVDAVIDHAEAASRQLGGANMHLPTHVNALAMNSFVNRIRPMSGRAA